MAEESQPLAQELLASPAESLTAGAPAAGAPVKAPPVEPARAPLPETIRGPAALVHDYLLVPRGAERTFAAIAGNWAGSPVYTSLFDAENMRDAFAGHSVTTSRLQRLGVKQGMFRALLPFFPKAMESLPVSDSELVISSSSAFAHGVRPGEDATHVCYCHSPFRYVWHERDLALEEAPRGARFVLRATLDRVRGWDREASTRVTHYVANSEITRQRIAEYYGRDSWVIHPPVEVDRFGPPAEPEDYFLYVGEVTLHKRVDVAARAAQLAGKRLKVVGTGPEQQRLERLHGDSVEFLGRAGDEELNDLYSSAAAVIVPKIEEFGIVAVEAQAAGRPVVAIDRGGTSETVVDGETGVLVPDGTAEEFAEAMAETDFSRFDGAAIQRRAQRWSVDRFQREMDELVARAVAAGKCDSLF